MSGNDQAQDMPSGPAGQTGASTVPSADTFVDRAAVSDMYEIAAARLALCRSSSPEVQVFAAMMLADHTTSAHHLQAALEMLETRGVAPPPDELPPELVEMLEELQAVPDDRFDPTYLDQQVAAHEEALALLTGYRDAGDNAQLRSYAAAFAPVVERHLQRARELRAH